MAANIDFLILNSERCLTFSYQYLFILLLFTWGVIAKAIVGSELTVPWGDRHDISHQWKKKEKEKIS